MLSHLYHPHASNAGKTGIVSVLSVYVHVCGSASPCKNWKKIPTRSWCNFCD